MLLKCDQRGSYQLKCTQEFLFQTRELSSRNQSYKVAAIDREIKGIQFLPDRPKLLQIAVSLKYLTGNLFSNPFPKFDLLLYSGRSILHGISESSPRVLSPIVCELSLLRVGSIYYKKGHHHLKSRFCLRTWICCSYK